jgi:hypothetical protein
MRQDSTASASHEAFAAFVAKKTAAARQASPAPYVTTVDTLPGGSLRPVATRVLADAVLVGAGTVRGGTVIFSVWHPEMVELRQASGLARHPTQIVATKGGLDLDRGILFNTPDRPVIVLTEPAGATSMAASLAVRPWIRSIVSAGRADRQPPADPLPGPGPLPSPEPSPHPGPEPLPQPSDPPPTNPIPPAPTATPLRR